MLPDTKSVAAGGNRDVEKIWVKEYTVDKSVLKKRHKVAPLASDADFFIDALTNKEGRDPVRGRLWRAGIAHMHFVSACTIHATIHAKINAAINAKINAAIHARQASHKRNARRLEPMHGRRPYELGDAWQTRQRAGLDEASGT